MAIQIRRGNEADLDISQLKAGELAACLDTQKIIVKLSGGNYLTLTDVPALRQIVDGKANASDIPDVSAFITRLVNDLANYYTKSETYTQAEVNALVSAIPKFAIEVAQTLPITDISPTTVYLVPGANSSSPNLYTEYIYVNHAWECLGTQTVDLSGYVTTEALNNALANKANLAHTHTKAQITDLTIDSTPTENSTNPITSGGVFNAINDIATGGNISATVLHESSSAISTATNNTVTVTIDNSISDYDFVDVLLKVDGYAWSGRLAVSNGQTELFTAPNLYRTSSGWKFTFLTMQINGNSFIIHPTVNGNPLNSRVLTMDISGTTMAWSTDYVYNVVIQKIIGYQIN